MFIAPAACILFGCLSNLPLDRVSFNKNFVGIHPASESNKTKYYEKGKACYIDGVFYQSCP